MVIIAGCLIEKNNKFLMVKEAKKKCYGQWNFPAGHLEENETIKEAAIRGYVYSRISTLRQMINCKPRYIEIENKLRKEILSYKNNILKNKKIGKRDKIAVVTLVFGVNAFRFSWNSYCKITGRNM